MEMINLDERARKHFILPKATDILFFGISHREEIKLSLQKQSFLHFNFLLVILTISFTVKVETFQAVAVLFSP